MVSCGSCDRHAGLSSGGRRHGEEPAAGLPVLHLLREHREAGGVLGPAEGLLLATGPGGRSSLTRTLHTHLTHTPHAHTVSLTLHAHLTQASQASTLHKHLTHAPHSRTSVTHLTYAPYSSINTSLETQEERGRLMLVRLQRSAFF